LAVKKRNPIFVIVASFVTFFIYCLYWFYSTRRELNELTGQNFSPILWTIGLFVPIANIYVIWKYSEDVEAVSKKAQNKVVLFLAWIVFFPIAQYLTQEELNKLAK
jgi:F0F1-type ATP synthase membrane subunit a